MTPMTTPSNDTHALPLLCAAAFCSAAGMVVLFLEPPPFQLYGIFWNLATAFLWFSRSVEARQRDGVPEDKE